MNNEKDYYKEAGEFLDRYYITMENLEKKVLEYFDKNEFGRNERMIFCDCIIKQIELKLTISRLKFYCDRPIIKKKEQPINLIRCDSLIQIYSKWFVQN